MKDAKMTPSDEGRVTRKELKNLVEKAIRTLDDARFGELVTKISRVYEELGVVDMRAPFALKQMPDECGRVTFEIKPDVCCRLTHLVLSPDTAKLYELASPIIVGNVYQTPGGSISPIPLETYSIEYMSDNRLAEVQSFKSPKMHPGLKAVLMAQLRDAKNMGELQRVYDIEFRGLLWADCF